MLKRVLLRVSVIFFTLTMLIAITVSINWLLLRIQGEAPALPALVSYVTKTNNGDQARNDFDGYVGMEITTGDSGLTVEQLGRYYLPGNNGTHILKIVRASDGADLASVSVNMGEGIADTLGFKYASLGSPVTLSANTSYYIVSLESTGGDQWYGDSMLPSLTTTDAAVIKNAIYYYNDTWNLYGSSGNCYVPLNFKYPGK